MDKKVIGRDMKMVELCNRKKWDKVYDYLKSTTLLPQEQQNELYLQWSGCSLPQRILCEAPDITIFLPFFPVNTKYLHERTALYFAVVVNYYEAAKRLLENGADPNIADVTGKTPAFCARDAAMIDLLENFGADFDIKDLSGHSIIDWALDNSINLENAGNLAAMQYLLQKKGLPSILDPRIYLDKQISDSLYFQEFGNVYKKMYEIYQLCNQICWKGELPLCIIEIPKKFMESNVYAFAYPRGLCHNGVVYPKISFKRNTLDSSPGYWGEILLHEMIHIWEYAQNGGRVSYPSHGKVFREEAKRIGISWDRFMEKNTPAAQALQEISRQYPFIRDELKEVIKTNIQHNANDDVNFFAEQYIHHFKKQNE